MDDIHYSGSEQYNRAEKIEKLSASKQFLCGLKILFTLLPNVITALATIGYSVLTQVYHLMFPKPLLDIRGQLAVVTGGGNGIGREICLQLAAAGCNVAVLDMDVNGAETTCRAIRHLGVTATPYKIDVGDYDQVVAVKKLINRDMGPVDILVNNAGLMPKMSLFEGRPEDIQRVINVNVIAHFWTVRVFIEDMINRRQGHIVAIASMIAFYPSGRATTYTTTKYAVKGFMEALDQEMTFEQLDIKTVTVFPHFVNTRKELVDCMREIVGQKMIEQVGIQSPKHVAVAAVNAIQNGSKTVSVPGYYLGLGKFFASLPTSWQNIITETVMPQTFKPKMKTNQIHIN